MVRKFPIILICGSLCLPACSTDPIGKTYPVKGKVYLDGVLLKAGSVAFWPAGHEGASAFEAGGKIKPDGAYELSTRGKPGALLGRDKVTVVLQNKVEPNKAGDVVSLVPKEYTNKETTPLKVQVIEKPEDGGREIRSATEVEVTIAAKPSSLGTVACSHVSFFGLVQEVKGPGNTLLLNTRILIHCVTQVLKANCG